MLRWPAALLAVITTALLSGPLEPALAASDALRILLMLVALVVFRSPLWLTSLLINERAEVAT